MTLSKIKGRKIEGSDIVFRFAPVGLENQAILLGDTIHWSLRVFDRTERNINSGKGLITMTVNPSIGHWIQLNDGFNAIITYELGVTVPSSPYNARAVAIGVDIEATRDNLITAITADVTAGFMQITATANATDKVDLLHTGPNPALSVFPVVKSGNSLTVTGMDGLAHFQLLEQSPAAQMFPLAQTSTQDPGWDDDTVGYTFRYDFVDLLAPLKGGRTYDFEFQLLTRLDGTIPMIGRVGVMPLTSPVVVP